MKKVTPKKTTANRFRVFNAFMDFTAGDLLRSEILVWMTLYRDTRDGFARSSQESIARRCGISRKTVERAISSLRDRKLLRVVRQGGLNRGSSTYRVFPITEEQVQRLAKND